MTEPDASDSAWWGRGWPKTSASDPADRPSYRVSNAKKNHFNYEDWKEKGWDLMFA